MIGTKLGPFPIWHCSCFLFLTSSGRDRFELNELLRLPLYAVQTLLQIKHSCSETENATGPPPSGANCCFSVVVDIGFPIEPSRLLLLLPMLPAALLPHSASSSSNLSDILNGHEEKGYKKCWPHWTLKWRTWPKEKKAIFRFLFISEVYCSSEPSSPFLY